MYPSRACTLPTPLIVTLCSVLLWTEYIAPGKAVPRTSPLSNVPLCIQFGSVGTSLCLQIRVIWSEQFPPWSSRETLKAAVKGSAHTVSSRGSAFNYGDYNNIPGPAEPVRLLRFWPDQYFKLQQYFFSKN